MNIKTNLLEEYVNLVDNTNKRNKKLWMCTSINVFMLIILTIIGVFRYLNEYYSIFKEINKTANMDPNLLTRHYKLKLMNDSMHINYQNPKMKQFEIANHLKMSSSTLQRYRNEKNMLSPYRINPNNVKKRSKRLKSMISMTSKDLK